MNKKTVRFGITLLILLRSFGLFPALLYFKPGMAKELTRLSMSMAGKRGRKFHADDGPHGESQSGVIHQALFSDYQEIYPLGDQG